MCTLNSVVVCLHIWLYKPAKMCTMLLNSIRGESEA
jgi:hypothetical protein